MARVMFEFSFVPGEGDDRESVLRVVKNPFYAPGSYAIEQRRVDGMLNNAWVPISDVLALPAWRRLALKLLQAVDTKEEVIDIMGELWVKHLGE